MTVKEGLFCLPDIFQSASLCVFILKLLFTAAALYETSGGVPREPEARSALSPGVSAPHSQAIQYNTPPAPRQSVIMFIMFPPI